MEFDAVESDHHQAHAPPERLGEGNRYRLGRTIGKGGMGQVFLATDTRLNKQVALKLLSPILLASEAARQRFKQECAICAVLESPHIVQVSDYGITAAGHPFYVMEYLQGETLSQRLAREQRLALEQVSSIVRQICAGLQVAHRGVVLKDQEAQASRLLKVIHRDLKPDNIFLMPTALGELVKVIDFGIAKIRSLQADSADVTQSLLGTSHYAAPEQFETAELDERTDIYSLGMILYEMLTGTDPYGLGFSTSSTNPWVSNTAWLTAHLTKTPQPLRSQAGCDQLPQAVEAVILRCLAKSPAERFASVEALNQAFQTAAANRFSVPEETVSTPIQSQAQPYQTSDSDLKIADSAQANSRFQSSADQLLQGASAEWMMLSFVTALMVSGLTLVSHDFKSFLQSSPSLQSEIKSKQLLKTFVGHQAAVWSLAMGADGKTLITGDEAGIIKVWNLQTGQVERTLVSESGPIRTLALDADGQYLASGGNRIQLWNLQTGLLRTSYARSAWTVALSQDHKILVSGSEDGQIRIWDLNSSLNTGQFRSLSKDQARVYAVDVSSNQKIIVSGGEDQIVKVWDVQSGALLNTFTGHQDVVRSVALSSQGDLVASGSWDKTIKIWNLQTKTLVHTLEGHQDRVVAVAFSQDGQTLVSASRDKTIKLWDVQTGNLLQTLSAHTDWVLAVGISQDGRVVSGSKDRTVKIWQ